MNKLLKKFGMSTLKTIAWALETLSIDIAFGNGKYRKHGPYVRSVTNHIHNRTVVMRPAGYRMVNEKTGEVL